MICLYTDGACSNNGKKNAIGGWSFCIIKDDEILTSGSGGKVNTTNNEMEYTAMLEGLRAAEKIHETTAESFECYTDSALLFNTLTQWIEGWRANNWRRKSGAIKNLELVKALYPYTLVEWLHFNHVRGHEGNKDENSKWNEYVDKLAVVARKSLKL